MVVLHTQIKRAIALENELKTEYTEENWKLRRRRRRPEDDNDSKADSKGDISSIYTSTTCDDASLTSRLDSIHEKDDKKDAGGAARITTIHQVSIVRIAVGKGR